jgi:hypothetical protein
MKMNSSHEHVNQVEANGSAWQPRASETPALSGDDDYQQMLAEAAFMNAQKRGQQMVAEANFYYAQRHGQ